MKYTLPRGTKDILPDEVGLWQHIETVSKTLFKTYGYSEIRTPVFESTGLFERGIGNDTDIVEKEMYTFKDKGDRQLTLRPEGTAPVVRSCIQHNLFKQRKINKLFYIGPMFRYERPQAGRYRQFHQIGVEYLGTPHPLADVEVVALGVRIFQNLGLDQLAVSINSVGCSICRPVIEERLKQFIGSNLSQLCSNCQRRFQVNPLRILDCKNKKCNTYFSGIPDMRRSQCRHCKDHFNTVSDYLDQLGIKFQVDPRLVRGLDYYSRTAFEIISTSLGAQNAICGGGRYDGLVKQMGGADTPAVGFAFGVERAVYVLQEMAAKGYDHRIEVFVAPVGKVTQHEMVYLLEQIRAAGISADMTLELADLKAQLKKANRLKANYIIIYGEDEASRHVVQIKNMTTRQQDEVSFDNVVTYLTEKLLSESSAHV